MKILVPVILIIILTSLSSYAGSIKVVDKDKPEWGIEVIVRDRNDQELLTSSDKAGIITDIKPFCSNRHLEVVAKAGHSYYPTPVDCPYAKSIIEMQSTEGLKKLMANCSSLLKAKDLSASLAFSELAARTANIDASYSQRMRKIALELSIGPITDAISLEDINKALLENGVIQEDLSSKSQIVPNMFIVSGNQDQEATINKAYSEIISIYQKKMELKNYWNGQLDYATLSSFAGRTSSDLIFRGLSTDNTIAKSLKLPQSKIKLNQ
jgi:hypothetical protein